MPSIWKDIQYAWRALARAPSFLLTAVASLALGITANVVVFSLINVVLFRPLPVDHAGELVRIGAAENGRGFGPVSLVEYQALEEGAEGLAAVVVHRWNTVVVNPGVAPREEPVEVVSANYFSALGVRPALGRVFLPDEGVSGRPARVAMVSHEYWQRELGADAAILGRDLKINGELFSIIGVTPAEFGGTFPGFEVSVWTTLSTYEDVLPLDGPLPDVDSRSLMLLGRLAPGVDAATLDAELAVVSRRLTAAYPRRNRNRTLVAAGADGVLPAIAEVAVPFFAMLTAVVTLVLVAACANVANLLLARAHARRYEVAVGMSLGAGPGRIVRQLLVESGLVALIAGAVALGLSAFAFRVLTLVQPAIGVPVQLGLEVDTTLMLYALAVSATTAAAFGLWPAIRAVRVGVIPLLRESFGSGRRHRAGRVLVVAQVAISVALLVTSGLFLRSLQESTHIDPGFDAANVLLISGDPGGLYRNDDRVPAHWQGLQARIASAPGVEQTALGLFVPLGGRSDQVMVRLPGAADDARRMHYNVVSPDYFALLRIAVVAGRVFTDTDETGPPPAVVNETLARWLRERGAAVPGARLGIAEGGGEELVTVVGVVADIKYRRLSEDPTPLLYLPVSRWHRSDLRLHVRTAGAAAVVARNLGEAAAAYAPEVPIAVTPMEEDTRFSTVATRFAGGVIAVAGLIGLIIAITGVFGVVAYITAQRYHEFGVRVALGATSTQVRRYVVAGGIRLVGAGLVVGVVLAVGIATLVRRLIFGVSPLDPITLAVVAALMFGVGWLGSYLPARRATRVNPVEVLRAM